MKELLIKTLFAWLFFVALSLATTVPKVSLVQAQTLENPQEETVLVSASIPDHFVPTAPILVYPENNAITDDNTPRFVWIGANDDTEMQYYQLTLDDVILFDKIPIKNHETEYYSLIYDPLTHQYALTPKNSLLDGIHTWKVTAVDTSGNSHDSVTWTFTIDTLVPIFILVQVGEEETSISAQDISTVPEEPIILQKNNPLLKAVGEPLARVELTVLVPGSCSGLSTDRTKIDTPLGCRETITIQIDEHGNWQYNLGLLPRETIITLDFLITDQAGHISILEGVQIIIVGADLPPEEVLDNIVDTITDLFPSGIQQLVTATPKEVTTTITISSSTISPFLALLIALTIPLLTLFMIATKFGKKFSLELFYKLLQALGLYRSGPPQGIVFDDETNRGVPFALVIVTSVVKKDANQATGPHDQITNIRTETDIAITDENGIYRGLKIPDGEYRISVKEPRVLFTTNKKRPSRLGVHDYYKGEIFTVGAKKTQGVLHEPGHEPGHKPGSEQGIIPLLLIPVSRISFQDYFSFLWQTRVFLARLNRHPSWLVFLLLGLCIIVSILSPSVINWLVVLTYVVILIFRLLRKSQKPFLSGSVQGLESSEANTETKKKTTPLEKSIVVLRTISLNPYQEQHESLALTNKKGVFSLHHPKQKTSKNQENKPVLYTTANFIHADYTWRNAESYISCQAVSTLGVEKITSTTLLVPEYQSKEADTVPTLCLLSPKTK